MLRIVTALFVLSITVIFQAAPADAADRCIRIQRQGMTETLVNICNVCQRATIIRSRPGSEVPVGRSYDIQPRSTFPVPFRGPGSTRVTNESVCPADAKTADANDSSLLPPSDGKRCISMQRSGSAGVVLINSCSQCRSVSIQRMNTNGAVGARGFMMVVGGGSLPLPSDGYAGVALLAESGCPGK